MSSCLHVHMRATLFPGMHPKNSPSPVSPSARLPIYRYLWSSCHLTQQKSLRTWVEQICRALPEVPPARPLPVAHQNPSLWQRYKLPIPGKFCCLLLPPLCHRKNVPTICKTKSNTENCTLREISSVSGSLTLQSLSPTGITMTFQDSPEPHTRLLPHGHFDF